MLTSKSNWLLIFSLFFFILVVAIQYRFPDSDQFEQIPVIQALLTPETYQNDWYVQHSNLSVRFFYMQLVAGLSSVITVKIAYGLLYLFSVIATFGGIFLVIFRLLGRKDVAVLTAGIVLLGFLPALGSSALFYPMVVPTNIAIPLTLFATYFVLKKQYLISAVFLSLATLIHILLGPLTAIFLAVLVLSRPEYRGTFSLYFRAGVTYIAISSLAAVPFLLQSHTQTTKLTTEQLLHIIAYVRHPWHYLPSQFSLVEYSGFVLLLISFIIFLKRDTNKTRKQTFLTITYIFAVFLSIGTIFVELFPIGIVIKLQLFRLSSYFSFYMFAYVVHTFLGLAEKKLSKQRVYVLLCCVTIITCSMLSVLHFQKLQLRKSNDESRFELYSWIKESTTRTAIFLVPPYMDDARYRMERAIVVDFKAFPFGNAEMVEWFSRIQAITNNQEYAFRGNRNNELIEGYCSLTSDDVYSLSLKYHFDYFLVNTTHCKTDYSFPQAYNNNTFTLYQIDTNG